MSDATCIICTDPLACKPLGAVVPCGHVFHHDCFHEWIRSKGRDANCCICNGKSRSFVKLFLPLEEMAANDNDDDISLSSTSTIGEGEDEKQEQEPENNETGSNLESEQNNDTPVDDSEAVQAAEAQEEVSVLGMDCPEDNLVPGDEGVGGAAARQDIVQNTQGMANPPPQQIAVRVSTPVIDLSSSPQSSTNARRRRQSQGTSDNEEYLKLRRKAKRLKKRVRYLESQQSELSKARLDLENEKREMQLELRSKSDELEQSARDSLKQLRDLTDSQTALNRIRRERDELEKELSKLNARYVEADKKMQTLLGRHREELRKASLSQHAEVQAIVDRHPKLVQESRDLKQQLEKCQRRIEELERTRTRSSSTDNAKGRGSDTMSRPAESSIQKRKMAGDVARAFQEQREKENQREERQQRKREAGAQVQAMTSKTSQQGNRISLAAATKLASSKRMSPIDFLNESSQTKKHPAVARHVSLSDDSNTEMDDRKTRALDIGPATNLSMTAKTKKRKVATSADVQTNTSAGKQSSKTADVRDFFRKS